MAPSRSSGHLAIRTSPLPKAGGSERVTETHEGGNPPTAGSCPLSYQKDTQQSPRAFLSPWEEEETKGMRQVLRIAGGRLRPHFTGRREGRPRTHCADAMFAPLSSQELLLHWDGSLAPSPWGPPADPALLLHGLPTLLCSGAPHRTHVGTFRLRYQASLPPSRGSLSPSLQPLPSQQQWYWLLPPLGTHLPLILRKDIGLLGPSTPQSSCRLGGHGLPGGISGHNMASSLPVLHTGCVQFFVFFQGSPSLLSSSCGRVASFLEGALPLSLGLPATSGASLAVTEL